MDELIKLVPSIMLTALLTSLVLFPFNIAKGFVTHKKQREDLANGFSEDVGHRYRGSLRNALDWLNLSIGKPFSLKSFKFSLGIALFYPVVISTLMWLIGKYPYQLAGETIFPVVSAMSRLLITISLLLFIAIEFLVIRSKIKIEFWLERIPFRTKLLVNLLFSAVTIFILANIGYLDNNTSFVITLASLFVFLMTIVVGFSTAGAVALTVAFVFALIMFIFVSSAVKVTIFATIFAIGALIHAFDFFSYDYDYRFSADDFDFIIIVAFAFAFFFAVLDSKDNGVITVTTASWLFFLFLLPFINALFDFISTSFSRLFSRLLIKKRDNWIVVTLWLLFDLVLAFWFLIGLVVALVFTSESLNKLLPATDTLIPWKSYIEQTRSQPLGAGFFMVFMLYSTLIPTVLHIGFGLYSLLFSVQPLRRWLVNRLRQPYSEDYLPKHIYQETAVLSMSWVLTLTTALLLVPFGLYKLMQFRPAFNDGLYRLAYWAGDLAAKLF